MNEFEIERLIARAMWEGSPEVRRYAEYLRAWVEIVNRHSDGWPYWRAGADAGRKVASLITRALDGGTVSAGEWGRAVGNVKATATRQLKHSNRIPVPTLGEV